MKYLTPDVKLIQYAAVAATSPSTPVEEEEEEEPTMGLGDCLE